MTVFTNKKQCRMQITPEMVFFDCRVKWRQRRESRAGRRYRRRCRRQRRGPVDVVGPPGGRLGQPLQEEEHLRQGAGPQRDPAPLSRRCLAPSLVTGYS